MHTDNDISLSDGGASDEIQISNFQIASTSSTALKMPPKDALRVREVDKGSKAAGGDSLIRQ
jgi:hypothetical protein